MHTALPLTSPQTGNISHTVCNLSNKATVRTRHNALSNPPVIQATGLPTEIWECVLFYLSDIHLLPFSLVSKNLWQIAEPRLRQFRKSLLCSLLIEKEIRQVLDAKGKWPSQEPNALHYAWIRLRAYVVTGELRDDIEMPALLKFIKEISYISSPALEASPEHTQNTLDNMLNLHLLTTHEHIQLQSKPKHAAFLYSLPAIIELCQKKHFDFASFYEKDELNLSINLQPFNSNETVSGFRLALHKSLKDFSAYILKDLKSGASINAQDSAGKTILHYVASKSIQNSGSFALINKKKLLEKVKFILQCGVHVDIQDIEGKTALHYASACCNQDIIDCLIEHGAKVDIQDHQGKPSFAFHSNNRKQISGLIPA